jgi:hypothetical protein
LEKLGKKKFPKVQKNESPIYQNLWDTAKAELRGKLIAMSAYNRKSERSQINKIMIHFKVLEKKKPISKPMDGKK